MSKIVNLENADRVGKAYLIDYLVTENGYARADATESVNAVLEAVTVALRAGANVSLSNIGTLRIETAPERTRRNPSTGETFLAPPQNVVRWTTSKTFSDVLNGRDNRDSLAVKAPKGTLS